MICLYGRLRGAGKLAVFLVGVAAESWARVPFVSDV